MTIPQLNMLKLFTHHTFTAEQALKLDQRVFGGLCSHQWVNYYLGHGEGYFNITEAGIVAFEAAKVVHNFRLVNNGRFSIRVPKVRRSNMIAFSKRKKVA